MHALMNFKGACISKSDLLVECNGPVNSIKDMLSWPVYLVTFPGKA